VVAEQSGRPFGVTLFRGPEHGPVLGRLVLSAYDGEKTHDLEPCLASRIGSHSSPGNWARVRRADRRGPEPALSGG